MSFPGPQKNKIEYFVHRLYEHRKGALSKRQIMPQVEKFPFAPDVQVFFKELPDRDFGEEDLVQELNRVIEERGRADAIGGLLQKRDQIPPEWEEAYRREYRH